MKNIIILKGGGGTEHDISLISAKFIESQIDKSKFNIYSIEIDENFQWLFNGNKCELNFARELIGKDLNVEISFVIPCLHGYPGETGDIQSYLELIKLPFLGCNSETSTICFNKLLTKLFLEQYSIKTTPFLQLSDQTNLDNAVEFLKTHESVYVKATNQGSSVGCYRVTTKEDLIKSIQLAFTFSPFVIIEKDMQCRELEVAVFEHAGVFHTTLPGEIVCPDEFYTYEEKYSSNSHTKTLITAENVSKKCHNEIIRQAQIAIKALKIRHLSRIDFFLTENEEVFINEINTFPGHTEISMFPSMMKHHGVDYSDFINEHISTLS